MVRVFSKLSNYGIFGLVCLSLGACSQGRSNVAAEVSEPQVGAIESALEDPISQCQDEQTTCVGAAMDRAAVVECSVAFRVCLGGAAESGPALAEALQQCRENAAQCAAQGGATGTQACRDELETCVSAASSDESQPPAADAGTAEEPQPSAAGSGGSANGPGIPGRPGRPGLPGRRLPFAGAGGIGGLPTLPGFPRLPGAGSISLPSAGGRLGIPGRPGRPGRPGSEAATACYEALRMCVEAPNADLNQCATTARACLREGGPLGAAGAGGAP